MAMVRISKRISKRPCYDWICLLSGENALLMLGKWTHVREEKGAKFFGRGEGRYVE